MAYLLLYVDDIVLTASSSALLQQTISALRREFAMKDLGLLHHFLGLTVEQRPDNIFLQQWYYILDILERAGMTDCTPCSTPVDTQAKGSLLLRVLQWLIPLLSGVLPVHFSTSPSPGRTSLTPCNRSVSICMIPGSHISPR